MEITLTFRVNVNEDVAAEQEHPVIQVLIAEAISAWEYEGIIDSVIEAEGKEE